MTGAFPWILFALLAILGSLQDFKTKQVSLAILGFLFFISCYLRSSEWESSIFWMLVLLSPFIFFRKNALGRADIMFMLSVALQFPLKTLPFFLFTSGALGVCTYFLLKRQSPFPFFPALFLSWGLTTLLYRSFP